MELGWGEKENTVHRLIVEKVSTYDTFAVSRDLSKYPDKFKEMCRKSKESFLCVNMLDRLYQRKARTTEMQYLLKNVL
jgi:hypothetical protein